MIHSVRMLFTLFLSTPSVRRATDGIPAAGHEQRISIHALREEGDSWSKRSGWLVS